MGASAPVRRVQASRPCRDNKSKGDALLKRRTLVGASGLMLTGSLLVLTGHFAYANRQRIAELATRHRLRAMFDLRPYVAKIIGEVCRIRSAPNVE